MSAADPTFAPNPAALRQRDAIRAAALRLGFARAGFAAAGA
jgi:hypothetical protein